jgi:hypothetical protein
MANRSHHNLLHLINLLLKGFVIAVEDKALFPKDSSCFELNLEEHCFGLKIDNLELDNEFLKH